MADKTEDTDELILTLLKANDTGASSLLYEEHYKAVYNSVKKYIRNTDEAKDITQELFINVWDKRAVLNITKPIRKYLLSAAHNRVINYKRDLDRNHRLMNEVVDRSGGERMAYPVDVHVEAKELEKMIKEAIALLPDTLRKKFSMSRKLGMTYKEMAAHLKVSEKAVEKGMTKALKLMRIMLGKYINVLLLFTDLGNLF